jgi:hypothetical protein
MNELLFSMFAFLCCMSASGALISPLSNPTHHIDSFHPLRRLRNQRRRRDLFLYMITNSVRAPSLFFVGPRQDRLLNNTWFVENACKFDDHTFR